MDLSLSPAAKDKLKNLLICLSVGNLCFLRRWYDLEHLQERSVDYYRTAPPSSALLISTLITSFLLGTALYLLWMWVERRPTMPGKLKLAQFGFLLLLMYPIESIRRYWNEETYDWGSNAALLCIEAILGAGIVMLFLGNTRVVRACRRVALVLTLLFPSMMMDFLWVGVGAENASAFVPKPPLPMVAPEGETSHKVVWLLFDEFDQRLAFDQRPADLELPELDRLRSESFVGQHATQTAGWTMLALPNLITGHIYSEAKLVDATELRLYNGSEDKKGADWREVPNVFQNARTAGANTELIGWHHPYCRVLGNDLVRCTDVPSGHPTAALLRETNAGEEGVARTVPYLFRLQLENIRDIFRTDGVVNSENLRDTYVQKRQLQQYFRIRDQAYREAVDKQIDFLFIHFPLPHLFALYDRKRKDFKLSGETNYFDNLALVDRTVGEVRRTLEQAGLWESTNLVITSDHGLRPEMWRGRYNWSPEMDRLTQGKQSETVPFIVKVAGQKQGAVYDKPFSNVVTGDLVVEMLRGRMTTTGDVASWIDARTTPSEAPVSAKEISKATVR